jgi:PAS domain S-box-containing protein
MTSLKKSVLEKKSEIDVLEAARTESAKAKKTEDEVGELTESIINTIREPLLLLNKNLHVVRANSSFYKFFKVNEEMTVGKLIYELGNSQWDIPALRELLENILPEKSSYENFEVQHVFSAIGKRTMLLNARQILQTPEKEMIILLAIEDITNRKISEDFYTERERMTNEYLDILFNHAHVPIIIWDTDSVITRYNKAFEELIGYKLTGLKEIKLHNLFPKDKADSSLELIKESLNNDRPEVIEVDLMTKDNIVKTVLWNSTNIFDTEGKNVVATVAQDITNRKQSEVALSILETRYRSLFESAKDGILILDAETGKIVDVNPFLIDLLGYSKKEFIEKFIWEIGTFKDIYENKEKFLELQQEEYVRYDDLPLETYDGRIIHVEFVSNVYLCNNIKVIQCNIRDITDRINIIKEIEFQADLINNVGQAVIATDLMGQVIYWNNAAKKIYGWSSSEAMGQNIINLTPAQQSNEQAIEIMKNLSEGKSWTGEFQVKRKDGSSFPALVTDTPILDSNSKLTGIIGISSDITERKHIQQKINDSEKRFRAIFDQAPFAIALIDKQGKILISNLVLSKMIGYSTDELSGMKFTDFTYPEDVDKDMKSFTDLTTGKIYSYTLEKRYVHKNGAIVWVNISISLLSDVSGNLIEILGIAEDITERKNSENKLKESEEKFKIITENSADAIFITDKAGKYIYVNKQAVDLLGYSKEEFLKFTIADISPRNRMEEYSQVFQRLFNTGSSYSEIELVKKDGSLVDTDLNTVLLPNGWVYGSCRDISSRKELEKELVKSKDKAEESDRLKSAFLANMSHEIRTPMNGILGFTSLLKEPHLTGDEQQEYIKIIEKSGDRMLNIINDIISISRVDSGQIEILLSETNVNEQIREIFNFFKLEAELKGIRLYISNLPHERTANVITDKEKLYAVLTNLVKNALKFTQKGTIEIGYIKKEDFLEFFVRDTGQGVTTEQKELIFDRFRQGSESLSRNYEGAGLGLSISKAYVELLGGKIWVESVSKQQINMELNEASGSTFYFTIPWNPLKEDKIEKLTEAASTYAEKQSCNLKILIVEDDPTSEMYISTIITNIAREILYARTGREAVEVCRDHPDIELVLMDMKMPEMDGYEATRLIRGFNKEVVIIAQTAHGLLNDKEKTIEAGCNDYISKPIIRGKLLKIIDSNLQMRSNKFGSLR